MDNLYIVQILNNTEQKDIFIGTCEWRETHFQKAKLFNGEDSAKKAILELFKEGEVKYDFQKDIFNYKTLPLKDYPADKNFLNSFDFTNIPDNDRDVQFVYRDGSICGVTTNFLREEMLKGRYLDTHSDFCRWRYIPDTFFLKIKKGFREETFNGMILES